MENSRTGAAKRAGHFVVDGSLLFEPQRLIRVFSDAKIAHLAADLFVGGVGMKQRVQLTFEVLIEDLGTGGRVEEIGSAQLLRESIGSYQRHCLGARDSAADA